MDSSGDRPPAAHDKPLSIDYQAPETAGGGKGGGNGCIAPIPVWSGNTSAGSA
jgi:hypothetical protein